MSERRTNGGTMLVVTPLPEEHRLLDAALARHGHSGEPIPCGPIRTTRYRDPHLVVAHGGHGKTQLGIQTRYLLDTLPAIDVVICAGAAGALSGSLAIGDIVLGKTTIEHDYLLKFATRPLPSFPGDPALLAWFSQVARANGLPFHAGAIASGDEDIVDIRRGAELAAMTGAIAVAWEGAGAARACELSGTPWLEIRAVTDTADHAAPADFETNLEVAMTNIAALLTGAIDPAG